jgi:hypothetical protein
MCVHDLDLQLVSDYAHANDLDHGDMRRVNVEIRIFLQPRQRLPELWIIHCALHQAP